MRWKNGNKLKKPDWKVGVKNFSQKLGGKNWSGW